MVRATCGKLPGAWLASFAILLAGCTHSGSSGRVDIAADAAIEIVGELVECPDGLVSPSESGICAPLVEECANPWELPVIGGGCAAIGPRGCPVAWDSGSTVTCEAGELLPCPEGFVEAEDGAACIPHFREDCATGEIPVLGGGCVPVGPEWDGDGGPEFDQCGPGELALPGGGCRQVGPRACPKLWDVASEADCEVGETLSCPEGWVTDAEDVYCEPEYDHCPFGERPLLGGGCQRVIPAADACPEGQFPAVPDGVTDIVYALAASSCAGGCGSPGTPYPGIQEAIDAVPEGGWVLVGAGEYDEGIAIGKPVHVIGLCASKVTLTGTVAVVSNEKSRVDAAGIAVLDTDGVEIAGIGVLSPLAGVALVNADDFVLSGVEVSGSAGIGVYAAGGSEGALDELWVHDTVEGEGAGQEGQGVWVEDGAEVSLTSSLVEQVPLAGVYARKQGTSLTISDTTIRGVSEGGLYDGLGVSLEVKASAELKGVVLEENRGAGALARSGSSLLITRSVVRNPGTAPVGDESAGVAGFGGAMVEISQSLITGTALSGVVAMEAGTTVTVEKSALRGDNAAAAAVSYAGGHVELHGCFVGPGEGPGLAASDSGSTATAKGCLFSGNAMNAWNFGVCGIHAEEGGAVTVGDTVIEGAGSGGVGVSGAGTSGFFERVTVRDAVPLDGDDGWGMGADTGGSLGVTDSLVEGCTLAGVLSYGAGTEAVVAGSQIRDVSEGSYYLEGPGVGAVLGGRLEFVDGIIEGATSSGVYASDPGSHLTFINSTVRGTLPGTNSDGWGIAVLTGAQLIVGNGLVEKNAQGGMILLDPDTEGTVVSSVFISADNGGAEVERTGILAATGSKLVFTDSLVTGVWDGRLAAIGPGTQVEVAGAVLRGTESTGQQLPGLGLFVDGTEGVNLQMERSLVDGCSSWASVTLGSGADVSLESSVFRGTHGDPELGGYGPGVYAAEGAGVSAHGCLVEDNAGVGVFCAGWEGGEQTKVDLTGSVVRGTGPDLDGQVSSAVSAAESCRIRVEGSLLAANRFVGMALSGPAAEGQLRGTIVRDTQAVSEVQLGVGLGVVQGATAEVHLSRLKGNHTGGVVAYGAGTRVSVNSSAIVGTLAGGGAIDVEGGSHEGDVFGDGLVVSNGAAADISSSILADNSRCGIFYSEGTGSIIDSVVSGNSSFGLAMEDCAEMVGYEEGGNFFFGNALGLPAALAADVSSNPEGLPVPPPPGLTDLPR